MDANSPETNGNRQIVALPAKGWTWLKARASEAEYAQLKFMTDRDEIRRYVHERVDEITYQEFRKASRTDEEIATDKKESRTIHTDGKGDSFHSTLASVGWNLNKAPLWRSAEPDRPADPNELVPCPEVVLDKDPHAL